MWPQMLIFAATMRMKIVGTDLLFRRMHRSCSMLVKLSVLELRISEYSEAELKQMADPYDILRQQRSSKGQLTDNT